MASISARTRRASARSSGSAEAASASRRRALFRLRCSAASWSASRIASESLWPSLRRRARSSSDRSSSRAWTVLAIQQSYHETYYKLARHEPPSGRSRDQKRAIPARLGSHGAVPRAVLERKNMPICRDVRFLPGASPYEPALPARSLNGGTMFPPFAPFFCRRQACVCRARTCRSRRRNGSTDTSRGLTPGRVPASNVVLSVAPSGQ